MSEYKYGMRERGYSIGCQPKEGLLGREDSSNRKYYDIIVYNRPLTKKECSDYALDDLEEPELNQALAEICEETGTSKAGIRALIKYYTEGCGWSEESAVEYIYELFDNGTITQIKMLGKDGDEI